MTHHHKHLLLLQVQQFSFSFFRQGTSLESAECTVLAETWSLSSAPLFPVAVPFCFWALCLCVTTGISLSIPQSGMARRLDSTQRAGPSPGDRHNHPQRAEDSEQVSCYITEETTSFRLRLAHFSHYTHLNKHLL